MKGMEYRDYSGDALAREEALYSADWVMQQKFDGTRALIDLETLQVTQRNGKPLKHTAATQHIPAILQDLSDIGVSGSANIVLDGELMIDTGIYYVFDVVRTSSPGDTLETRLESGLEQLPAGRVVRPVRTVRTLESKRALVAACADREGVVAKRLDGRYEPGVRVDHVRKFKNVQTADLVVTRLSASPLSARLGAHTEQGDLVSIGSASMIGKDPAIREGDVVEVSFLYWTGTSIVQPRIVRRREDKAGSECALAQFRTYSREEAQR